MLKFWKKKPSEPKSGGSDGDASTATATEQYNPPAALPDAFLDKLGDAAAPTVEAAPAPETTASAGSEDEQARWNRPLGGSGFARGMASLFGRRPALDDDLLDDIETTLISADVGVAATTQVVDDLRRRLGKGEFADARALFRALRTDLAALLEPVAQPLDIDPTKKPFVILTVGVNGVGKTTTIGKLAKRFSMQGRDVMLAAGDTFRAAAVEQLQTWGERNGVPVVSQKEGADSASVIFDALQSARSRRCDLLIADTAGRLHTQAGLMDELTKIRRVMAKLDAETPHEVLMVIDGTTGQNAVNQVRQFREAAGVTGLVVTKLDGSAKGGVVFALAREFGLPIRYVGLGEKADDLRAFVAERFVEAMLPESLAAG